MPYTSSSRTKSAPKRACDACHRRKVRCVPITDESPAVGSSAECRNCKTSFLACTYDTVPQKKGPKGSRAKVISELRERHRRPSFSSSFTNTSTPPISPSLSQDTQRLPSQLVDACIEYFFENVYPTQPILERSSLQYSVDVMYQDPHAYCLVSSLCAYMLIQPNMTVPAAMMLDCTDVIGSTKAIGTTLIRDVLQVRKTMSLYEDPSIQTIITSFFLFGSYFCLEKHPTAWAHLREATTVALLLNMHQEQSYEQLSPVEADLKRRLYWLLYVTERAYALQQQRPLTLYDTISMPKVRHNPAGDPKKLIGFIHLIQLYKPFDHTFMGVWNQSITNGTTAEWICSLQKQLSEALPDYLGSTEVQAVDLKTSQQWLRVMIWQLSISQQLLSSHSTDESMTFKFPLELSRQLAEQASHFSHRDMEVHGIGLIKKLFDVACTLIDVMSYVPLDPPRGFEAGPRQCLDQFINLMQSLRGGQDRYLPLLIEKIHETLPEMIDPQISRGLLSSTIMMTCNTHMDHLNAMTCSSFTAPGLKSEFSSPTRTNPLVCQYADGEASALENSSPYSMVSRSSYPG